MSAGTFQVQRTGEGAKADIILTLELGGQRVLVRMTADEWSKALATQQPAPVASFKLGA